MPIPQPKENNCRDVGPLFSSAPNSPFGSLFGSASDVDMMDFEYTVSGTYIIILDSLIFDCESQTSHDFRGIFCVAPGIGMA